MVYENRIFLVCSLNFKFHFRNNYLRIKHISYGVFLNHVKVYTENLINGIKTSWWGQKYGFVSGGFLGAKIYKDKSSNDSKRETFAEEDQENLYNRVQEKATSGKQGLGIKDRPKKVAGCFWGGKKTSFDDSDGGQPSDSSNLLKRKHIENSKDGNGFEPKIKLKKLCRKLLLQTPSRSLKLKHLKELINVQSPVLANFSTEKDAVSYLKNKLEGSSAFNVRGKRVCLST